MTRTETKALKITTLLFSLFFVVCVAPIFVLGVGWVLFLISLVGVGMVLLFVYILVVEYLEREE